MYILKFDIHTRFTITFSMFDFMEVVFPRMDYYILKENSWGDITIERSDNISEINISTINFVPGFI